MVAAFVEAGSFKPVADIGLCQGVRYFFNAQDEDGFDGVDVSHDLKRKVAIAE